ncbi:UNVERIFIED_ORG: hypothetical protein GGD58_001158 [Rhizobium pisi]
MPQPFLGRSLFVFADFRNRQATEFLGCRHAGRAVVFQSFQDHGNGALLRMFRERDQHRIDGAAMADGFRGRPDADMPVLQGHHIVGAADIDMIGKDPLAIGCDCHRQAPLPLQHIMDGSGIESLLLAHRHEVGCTEADADLGKDPLQRTQR